NHSHCLSSSRSLPLSLSLSNSLSLSLYLSFFLFFFLSPSFPCVRLGLRLQDTPERHLWELHQWEPGGHHGPLRSREVYPDEYPGGIQVCMCVFCVVVCVCVYL